MARSAYGESSSEQLSCPISSFYDAPGDITAVSGETYAYDVGNRLAGSVLTGGGQTQTRTWSFDGWGLLRAETLPEIGSFGHGTILYPRYDARGKLLRRQDPRVRLSFSYDPAGRPHETNKCQDQHIRRFLAVTGGLKVRPNGVARFGVRRQAQ